MVYDAVSQPIERRYPDGIRHTFSYDEVGNRTAMADPTGRTTTVYDDRNYPTRVTNPDDKSVTYAYDARGQRRTMTDPDGGLFTYTHDAAARLHWMENPQNQRTTFTYDGVGRQTQKNLTNGSVTKHSYFDTGRLKVLLNTTSTGTIISSFAYAYDPAGNRTSVLESDGTGVAWRYDNTYQLVNEARGTPTTTLTWDRLTADQWAAMTPDEWATMAAGLQVDGSVYNTTYTYDPVGNRLVKEDSGSRTTYTYDAGNELLTEDDGTDLTTYTYDECGNRDTKETPSEITYYTWNEDNRMTEAEPVGGAVTFTYDADGKRVGKATSAETKKFIYDFDNLLQETDGSDTTQQEYTTTVEEYGDLVSEYDGTSTSYHHYDALGSTDALTDPDQASTDTWVYRAFGEVQSRTGTTETPFTFVGKPGYYNDPEIELYFARARYYDSATGQWLSQDPIAADENPYRYVHSDPVNGVDPTGLWREIEPNSNLWQMSNCDDTFESLVEEVNRQSRAGLAPLDPKRNKVCIRPSIAFPPIDLLLSLFGVGYWESVKNAWESGKPHFCGVYDTGNLTDSWPDGGDLLASVGSDASGYIANASLFYRIPLSDSFLTPDQIKNKIMEQSGTGRTPLRSMTLIGHSWDSDVRIGGVTKMGGVEVGGWFELTSLVNGRAHELRNPPWPTWEDAIAWRFPPICWFRTADGTTVRFVGCKTWKLAEYFALYLLRGDAVAWGTRKPTWAFPSGNPPNSTRYLAMGWGTGSDSQGWSPDTEAPLAFTPRKYHAAGEDYWTEFEAGN